MLLTGQSVVSGKIWPENNVYSKTLSKLFKIGEHQAKCRALQSLGPAQLWVVQKKFALIPAYHTFSFPSICAFHWTYWERRRHAWNICNYNALHTSHCWLRHIDKSSCIKCNCMAPQHRRFRIKRNISPSLELLTYLIFVTGTTGGACVKKFCQV